MRVLFYGADASNPHFGGIARITNNLLRYFNRNGVEAFAIAVNNHASVPSAYQFFFPSHDRYSEENRKYLTHIISKYKIDIIVNQAGMSMKDALFTSDLKKSFPNIKIILCVHNPVLTQVVNYPYLKEFWLRKHHLTFLFKLLSWPKLRGVYKRCGIIIRKKHHSSAWINSGDRIVMLSPGHMQEIIDVIGKKNADKVVCIPNCINLGDIDKLPKENMVLWVGSVDMSIKRVDYMLEIWKLFAEKNKDWKLYILGDGFGMEWAKDYVHVNNLNNVVFTGRVDPKKYYMRAKISCVTSSYESFSMVILESFKYGVVPIVNNNFPTASYLVKDSVNGFLPRIYEKTEFLSALQKVTSSDSLWSVMSDNCMKSARKFSTDNIGRKWLKLFDELKE